MLREIIYTTPEKSLIKTMEVIKQLEHDCTHDKGFIFFVKQAFRTKENVCKAIYDYIRNNFSYEDDPEDELIQSPRILLFTKKGDCDDFALFAKVCLNILGIESNYILFAREKNRYTHIAVITNFDEIIDGTNFRYNEIPEKYKYTKLYE
jgi:hypothetical protein